MKLLERQEKLFMSTKSKIRGRTAFFCAAALCCCSPTRHTIRDLDDSAAGSDSGLDTETSNSSDTFDTDSESQDAFAVDCGNCSPFGISADSFPCNIELCDKASVVASQVSATAVAVECPPSSIYGVLEHFGLETNDLAPRAGRSYFALATGPMEATPMRAGHSVWCDNVLPPFRPRDPIDTHGTTMLDMVEWTLELVAPKGASSFAFDYIFMSVEYEESVWDQPGELPLGDKFYALLQAPSTNGGKTTVINFTPCRNERSYSDFVCPAGVTACEEQAAYCYVGLNSAFSECCWRTDCVALPVSGRTDLGGTEFECASSREADGVSTGSSTGWLETRWPIGSGEEFSLTFHLHDTLDGFRDSMVIIDNFRFLRTATQLGTRQLAASGQSKDTAAEGE